MNKNDEFERGKRSAKSQIEKGEDAQKMFDVSHSALDQTQFDKGWQEACLENGAINKWD